MRLSVYKWSQYYLMYSPIWKHMVKSSYECRINHSYKNTINQFDQKNSFVSCNNRLSIAYNLLIKQSQQSTIDEKHLQVCQYWGEYKLQIQRKVKQILTMANNNTQQKQLIIKDQHLQIQQLFDDDLSHSDTYKQPINDKQQQLPDTNNQKQYRINQLSKRIVMNEIKGLLLYRQNNMKGSKNIQYSRGIQQLLIVVKVLQHLFSNRLIGLEEEQLNDWLTVLLQQYSLFNQLKQQIDKIIISTIIDSKEQQTYSSFTQITAAFTLLKQYNSMISTISRFLTRVRRSQRENGIQPGLCQQLQNVVNELNTKSQSSQMMDNCRQEIKKLQRTRELIDGYVKLMLGQANNKGEFQTLCKQLIGLNYYDDGDVLQQQQQSDRRRRANNSNNNRNTNRNSNPNQLKQQHRKMQKPPSPNINFKYQLWKLTQLIIVRNELKVIKNKYSIGMKQINQLMFGYLQQEIISMIEMVAVKMNMNVGKSNNNNYNYNNNHSTNNNNNNNKKRTLVSSNELQCGVDELIYLGSLVRSQIVIITSEQQKHQDSWSARLTKMLYRLDEQCKRRLLSIDVVEMINITNTTQQQTTPSSCSTISLLYSLLNNYNCQTNYFHINNNSLFINQQKLPKQLSTQQCYQHNQMIYYLAQTQLINKLIAHLEKYLIQYKQHILLTHEQQRQLKSILIQLKQQYQKQYITLNKQSLDSMEKIYQKLPSCI